MEADLILAMDAQRWLDLGLSKLEQQQYTEAGDMLTNAIQFDSTLIPAYEGLALVYIHQGKIDQALQQYQRLAELQPSPEITIKRAGLLLLLEQPKQAEELFKQVLDQDQTNSTAMKGLADSYFKQNNFDYAIRTYDKLLDQTPEDAFLWYSKAETYYRAQDHEAALEAIEHAIDLKQQPEFFAFKGDFYIRHDNFERALEQYRLAANLVPKDTEIRMRLGFIMRVLERPRDALAEFDQVLTVDPTYAEARENKIEIYEQMGKMEAARAETERLIRLDPDRIDLATNLILYYIDHEGYERAAELLEILIDVHYENPQIWALLANCMKELGQKYQATQAITKAIQYGDEENMEQYRQLKFQIENS